MKILRIALQEYRCYRQAEIDVSRTSITSIVGRKADAPERSNGSGKTSLLKSVPDALYGWDDPDTVQRLGATDDTFAEVEFLHRGRTCVVRRGFKIRLDGRKGDGFLTFTVDGVPQGEKIGETEEEIVRFLGCDRQTFMATSFFAQGEADEFARTTSSKRKAILSNLLRLGIYDDAKSIADAKAKVLQESIEAVSRRYDNERIARDAAQAQANLADEPFLQREILRLTERRAALDELLADKPVSLADIESCQGHLQAAREEEAAAKSRHSERLAEATRAKDEERRCADRLSQRSAAISAAQKVRADTEAGIPGLLANRDALRERVDAQRALLSLVPEPDLGPIHQTLARATVDRQEADRRIKEASAAADRLRRQGPMCGECGQAIGAQHRASHEAANAAALADAQRGRAQAAQDALSAQQAMDEARKASANRASIQALLRGLEADLSRAEIALQSAQSVAAAAAQATDSENAEIALLTDAKAQASARVSDTGNALQAAESDWAQARASLSAAESAEAVGLDASVNAMAAALAADRETTIVALDDATRGLSAYRSACDRARTHADELAKIKGEQDALDYDRRVAAFLGSAFGRNGIQQLIFENVVAEIERGTVAILETMESEFRVRFRMATASGRDTLSIDVETPQGVRPLKSFSGGQTAEINLAIRLSLAQVLARRSDVSFGSVFLDEVMAALDGPARQCFLRVVNLMRGSFDQVFVISHDSAIRDVLESSIVVTSDADGTTLEVAA